METYAACLTIAVDEDDWVVVTDVERFEFLNIYLAGHVGCRAVICRPQSVLAPARMIPIEGASHQSGLYVLPSDVEVRSP
jgi:hypothetical protein